MAEAGAAPGYTVASRAATILAGCSVAVLILGFLAGAVRPDFCYDASGAYDTLTLVLLWSILILTCSVPICLIVAAVMAVRRKASGQSQRATGVVLGTAGGLFVVWILALVEAYWATNCYAD
jgi:hypothetical protein